MLQCIHKLVSAFILTPVFGLITIVHRARLVFIVPNRQTPTVRAFTIVVSTLSRYLYQRRPKLDRIITMNQKTIHLPFCLLSTTSNLVVFEAGYKSLPLIRNTSSG